MMAEEVLNNSLGFLGAVVKDAASATHALTCGVPDRESNETTCLKEASDMINDWQSRCSRRSFESHEGPDRPQWGTADILHATKK